jgi:D-arabinose 1-dehydrogenase-like Zn-dependent alcohol dehydrogenase
MQAVTVVPGTAGSAKLEDVPEPRAELGSVVGEALAVGVCGTDAEIAMAREPDDIKVVMEFKQP